VGYVASIVLRVGYMTGYSEYGNKFSASKKKKEDYLRTLLHGYNLPLSLHPLRERERESVCVHV
jgi:hypothetical protein